MNDDRDENMNSSVRLLWKKGLGSSRDVGKQLKKLSIFVDIIEG